MGSKIIPLYLALLLAQIAHVFEEVWANFRAIEFFGSLGFLIANWVLILIPVLIFYYLLKGNQWAYYWGIGYVIIMILNGLGHNTAYILTGQYYGAFAGNYTGIGLILIGIPLAYYIWKEITTFNEN